MVANTLVPRPTLLLWLHVGSSMAQQWKHISRWYFCIRTSEESPKSAISVTLAGYSPGKILIRVGGGGVCVLGWLQVVVLFAPIRGGSLRIYSVCWMLCTASYGSTSLQQSSKGSCSLLVSGNNLRADCQRCTLVPPLNNGANAAPTSVNALVSAVVALNNRR